MHMTRATRRASLAARLAAAAAVPLAGAGAQGATAPPESVAVAFLGAVAAERWADAAGWLDLPRFDAYRRAARVRPVTAADLRRVDPDMPDAVAEYQLRRLAAEQPRFDPLAFDFGEGATADSVAAWPAAVAAARWLEARDGRTRLRRSFARQSEALARQGCGVADRPLPPGLGVRRPRVVLGAVVADSEAWALHREPDETRYATPNATPGAAPGRSDVGGAGAPWYSFPPPAALLMRRVHGAWRIVGTFGMLDGSTGGSGVSLTCHRRGAAPPAPR
jgi:hypothetical protein